MICQPWWLFFLAGCAVYSNHILQWHVLRQELNTYEVQSMPHLLERNEYAQFWVAGRLLQLFSAFDNISGDLQTSSKQVMRRWERERVKGLISPNGYFPWLAVWYTLTKCCNESRLPALMYGEARPEYLWGAMENTFVKVEWKGSINEWWPHWALIARMLMHN